LRDAAVGLAVENERIDRAADVVDRGDAHDFDDARFGIDFHFAHLAPVGKSADANGLGVRSGKRPAQRLGHAVPERAGRGLEDPDRAIRSFHPEMP
jgi:hypothetical protein